MLYIVATPIGNLKDISLRALETLKSVDGIICEDSRKTSILLNHYQISKPILVLNDFNEAHNLESILLKLTQGQNLALVSDAGTPLISDPGYKLVRTCLQNNISVDSLPGATSITTALTLSGLPPDKFLFLGYLPEKPGKRAQEIQNISQVSQILDLTFIFFVAPHKLVKTLTEIKEAFSDIEICLAKELTKIHQAVETKSISLWLEEFTSREPKGEYIALLNLKNGAR